MNIIWTLISGVLIIVGVIGTVAPFLPGPPLVFGGLLLYGFATGFEHFSGWTIGVFAFLTVFTFAIDFFVPALGASSSRQGAFGALAGTLLGVFILGPLGIVIGPFVGAFIGEFIRSSDPEKAIRVAWRSFVAFLVGTAIKLGVVFAMAGYFIYLLFQK